MIAYITLFLLVSHSLGQGQSTTKTPALKADLKQLGESKCDALFQSVSAEFMLMS
jgi:hypothetical protein